MMNGNNGHQSNGHHSNGNGAQPGEKRRLSPLEELGITDEDWVRALALVLEDNVEADHTKEASGRTGRLPRDPQATKSDVKLFLTEEQQILREVYQDFFHDRPGIRLVGSSDAPEARALREAVTSLQPDVLQVGVKTLLVETVDVLEEICRSSPDLGVVLLFASCDARGTKRLRDFTANMTAGCACLHKYSIDRPDHLTHVIHSVVQGRVVIDPAMMEILMGEPREGFLKDLTPRELDVLGWMARGYRNETIAEMLSRDINTIERHVNNIYSKVQVHGHAEGSDPRVGAVLMYLSATGLVAG